MPAISKYSSMIYRLGQIYFDEQLAPYQIGCGQQFFLLHIFKHPGINQYEVAKIDHYDKGTTARAVKKLEEQGYIIRKSDEKDRRIMKLFVTQKGKQVVYVIQNVIKEWHEIITNDLNEEEKADVEDLLGKIASNAKNYVIKER